MSWFPILADVIVAPMNVVAPMTILAVILVIAVVAVTVHIIDDRYNRRK